MISRFGRAAMRAPLAPLAPLVVIALTFGPTFFRSRSRSDASQSRCTVYARSSSAMNRGIIGATIRISGFIGRFWILFSSGWYSWGLGGRISSVWGSYEVPNDSAIRAVRKFFFLSGAKKCGPDRSSVLAPGPAAKIPACFSIRPVTKPSHYGVVSLSIILKPRSTWRSRGGLPCSCSTSICAAICPIWRRGVETEVIVGIIELAIS